MSKNKDHIWELGHGEVSIGFNPDDQSVKMERTTRPLKVGELVTKEHVGVIDESRPPVVIKFDSVAGLDVFMDRLERLRAKMVGQNESDIPLPEFY